MQTSMQRFQFSPDPLHNHLDRSITWSGFICFFGTDFIFCFILVSFLTLPWSIKNGMLHIQPSWICACHWAEASWPLYVHAIVQWFTELMEASVYCPTSHTLGICGSYSRWGLLEGLNVHHSPRGVEHCCVFERAHLQSPTYLKGEAIHPTPA